MKRLDVTPRAMWRTKVERLGFDFHTIDGKPYWREDAAYEFSSEEIDELEQATDEIHAMCLDLVAEIIQRGDYWKLGLNDDAGNLIQSSWRADQFSLYGRMDFSYGGTCPPKLLEYNADTPTALFEASVVQWFWLKDVFPEADQFNSIHEKLLAAWGKYAEKHSEKKIHFCSVTEAPEDFATTEYLRDTCIQMRLIATHLDISDIGWKQGAFVDLQDQPIEALFKLYPWEWLLQEPFAAHIASASTRWIEPAWKMLLSNKSILVALWEKYPGHPNLLPASHRRNDIQGDCVSKPRFGREGEGIRILDFKPLMEKKEDAVVYQGLHALPRFKDAYPVIGSWLIDGKAAGIGIREDSSLITKNTSCFVPHFFR
jgi:glutathionylspermidine synthase